MSLYLGLCAWGSTRKVSKEMAEIVWSVHVVVFPLGRRRRWLVSSQAWHIRHDYGLLCNRSADTQQGSRVPFLRCRCWYVRDFFIILQQQQQHHPFNVPLSGSVRLSQYQKGKTNLDFSYLYYYMPISQSLVTKHMFFFSLLKAVAFISVFLGLQIVVTS